MLLALRSLNSSKNECQQRDTSGTTGSGRNVRLRMGLPPVATKPLEQSLRVWLIARKTLQKTSVGSATRTILTVRKHLFAVGRTAPHSVRKNPDREQDETEAAEGEGDELEDGSGRDESGSQRSECGDSGG